MFTLCPLFGELAANGWRLGVRAGECKSSDGRQTFKFPQNFPRADTPHDAKPFVRCWRLFVFSFIKRSYYNCFFTSGKIGLSEFSNNVYDMERYQIQYSRRFCKSPKLEVLNGFPPENATEPKKSGNKSS